MADIAYCQEFMCEMGINSQAEARQWLLKNHPDRGGEVDPALFKKVTNCYSNRIWCEPTVNENSERSSSRRSSMRSSQRSSMRSSSSQRSSSRRQRSNSLRSSSQRSSGQRSSPLVNKSSKAFLLKKRKKIYNCMRQTENWSKMLPQHKFDSKKFDPASVEAAMHNASPKLEQLFQIIEQVDANDLETHGQLFKHFIFSDVKEEGYGAKILASAFVAKGYKNLISTRAVPGQKALKMTLLQSGADGLNKSFGLLSSSAIFSTDFTQKFKKEVLQTYNKRPNNIQGEDMRFIILDSGFKEGIDLFDVKYVHIFEPSMTIADLKQTIGRATRTCGQKGLNFEPNVGWPLYVYNYYIAVPEEFKDMYQASDPNLLENPEEDKYIFKNTTKFKDAALLYSEFDRTMTRLAEQLYKLAPVFSVDFGLTSNIHRIHDVTYLYDVTQQGLGQLENGTSGGARRAFKDIDEIKCAGKCGLRSTNDIPATVGFLLKVYLKYKHDRKQLPSKHMRNYLCAYMKRNPEYCQQVNAEWANRAAMVPDMVSRRMKKKTVKEKTPPKREEEKEEEDDYMDIGNEEDDEYMYIGNDDEYMEILPKSSSSAERSSFSAKRSSSSAKRSSSSAKKIKSLTPIRKSSAKTRKILNRTKTPIQSKSKAKSTPKSSPKAKSASSLKIANEVMQQLDLVPYVEPIEEIEYAIEEYKGHTDPKLKMKAPGPPPNKLNFTQMRDFIKTNYGANFTWDEIVVENKCVDPAAAKTKVGGASRIMKLNPTQDFVRTFFTPQSPYKGLLLFQSVGTGKTCTAIATATSSFEKEGYTILWVTRNTLKIDVYKNMFDDVCHIILAERMKRDGLQIPSDPAQRKRLLSKSWIEPISYKTFSNLLTPGAHNVYMDKLIERNGKTDILKKTLIIIDEAHKLYGGDLKASERPDMDIMERLVQKSYQVSGKDSAKLLIMTATPFTNSPIELFKLINLCKDDPAERITTDIKEFKRKYMNDDNILTEEGSKKLADKLSGYISYLNREQDPTQFAQPIMIEVPTIMSQIPDEELRKEFVDKIMSNTKEDKNAKATERLTSKAQLLANKQRIKVLKTNMQTAKKRIKETFKEHSARCKTVKNKAEKARCVAEAKREMEDELQEAMDDIKDELEHLKSLLGEKSASKNDKAKIKALKERVEGIKSSLVQEAMLVDRCKSLKLA